MVIVYTGNGKGKTTAALGLVLRSAGYGRKILIVQFGKITFSGELKSLKLLKNLMIVRKGKGFMGIMNDKLSLEEHQKAAQTTLERLNKEAASGKWDLIVADEILGTLAGKLIKLQDVMNLLKNKPEDLDLILTGRHAPQKIISQADLVTEMKEVKHPFRKGMLARKGIDY